MLKASPAAADLSHYTREQSSSGLRFLSKRMIVDAAIWFDFLLHAVSAYTIYILYLNVTIGNFNEPVFYVVLTVGILFALYIGLKRFGYYEALRERRPLDNHLSLFLTVVASFCMPLFALFLIKMSSNISRVWFISWMCFVYLTIISTRYAWRSLLQACVKHSYFATKVILIGNSAALQRAQEMLSTANSGNEVQLLSVYNLDAAADNEGGPQPEFRWLLNECRAQPADEVIIAMPAVQPSYLNQLIKTIKLLPMEISVYFDARAQDLTLYAIKKLGEMQTVSIQRPAISEWGRFAKSLVDYVSSAAVLLLLIPLLLLIALAIKLDSPGPVLFRQRRRGLNGRIFTVLKFRTMTVCEDGDVVKQAQKDDKRVTRLGRLLRRTSLDELPQFLNVLKGDMSIVGPRPHAIAHDTYYSSLLENYATRYRIKPGITGWAQVNGFRGEISENNKMEGRVKYDLEYIDNWTFWFDIYIMIITPFCSFFTRRAY